MSLRPVRQSLPTVFGSSNFSKFHFTPRSPPQYLTSVVCVVTTRVSRLSRSLMASVAPPPTGTPRLALLQILAGSNKAANLKTARDAIADAARGGAKIIALPECFNSPYATDQFPVFAEPMPESVEAIIEDLHPSTAMLSGAAAEYKVFLVGGGLRVVDDALRASR